LAVHPIALALVGGTALAVLAIGPTVVASELVDSVSSLSSPATAPSPPASDAPTTSTPPRRTSTEKATPAPSRKSSPPPAKPAPASKKPPRREVDDTDRAPEDNIEVLTSCDDNGKPYDIVPNNPDTRRVAAKMCANIQKSIDAAGWGG
jgi:hypothetical protein